MAGIEVIFDEPDPSGTPQPPQAPTGGLTPEALALALAEIEQEEPGFFSKAASVTSSAAGAVWSGAKDVALGAADGKNQFIRGTLEAANSTADLGYAGVRAAAGWLGYDLDTQNPARFTEEWLPGKPQTVTGGLINDVTQFAWGFLGAGKLMAGAGIGAATTVGGKIAQGAVKGAVADFTVFGPHEERVSDLIEAYPSLRNPVTAYLRSDKNDSEAEGRFKNMLEGLGVGAAVEMVFLTVKGLRHVRSGDAQGASEVTEQLDKVLKEQEAREATAESPEASSGKPVDGQQQPAGAMTPEGTVRPSSDSAAPPTPHVDEHGQLGLQLEGGGPGKDSPRPQIEENPLNTSPEVKRKVPLGSEDFKPIDKQIIVDETKLRELVSMRAREAGYRGTDELSGIRTDLMADGNDIKSHMDALSVVYREEYAKANPSGGHSQAEVTARVDRLADIIGSDPRMLLQRMQNTHKLMAHMDAETRLYEDMLTTVGSKLNRLAEMVDDPRGAMTGYANRMDLMDDFAKHYELMGNLQLYYKGIQSGTARTLNSMKWGGTNRKELLLSGDKSLDDLYRGGERNMMALAKRVKAAGTDPKALAKTTRGGFLNNLVGSVNEYWINSILSGPKTHLVNIMSNSINTAFLPAERFIAGAIRGGTQQGRVEMAEAALQYVGMAASLKDAIVLAGKALKAGDGILDPSNAAYYREPAISAGSWQVENPVGQYAANCQ